MTTNDLYQAALADRQARGGWWGTATHTFPNGAVVYCSVRTVAGRSITAKHSRTTYDLKEAGAEYSKAISRAFAETLLRA